MKEIKKNVVYIVLDLGQHDTWKCHTVIIMFHSFVNKHKKKEIKILYKTRQKQQQKKNINIFR